MGKCEGKCEVYSRVTGYMRPVSAWNLGKKEEFKDRKAYNAAFGSKSDTSDTSDTSDSSDKSIIS